MKKRKLLSLLLALAMSVTMAAPAWAAQTYRDVPPSHWAYEAVEEMSQQGIFNGVGDGNFAPAKTVSQAEFITMVVRQFFPAFEDDWSAETPRWWEPYADVALASGLLENIWFTTAYDNGAWDGAMMNEPIDRYAMAQILYNALALSGAPLPDDAAQEAALQEIQEVREGTDFSWDHEEAVASMYALGYLRGVNPEGRFDGLASMDRASACTVFSRIAADVPGKIALPDIPPQAAAGEAALADGSAFTEDNIRRLICGLREEYPEGRRYTNDDRYYSASVGMVGYGCAGFALACSDAAFGTLPLSGRYEDFDAIRVGDMLRVNHDTHSVIVLEKHENSVVVAEGNYNSSIHWGRSISRQSLESGDFYGQTRWPG